MHTIALYLLIFFCSIAIGQSPLKEMIEPNNPAKYSFCEDLVNKAIVYIKKNGIDAACKVFTHDTQWIKGEIYVSVLNGAGIILCDAHNPNLIWKNFDVIENIAGDAIITTIKSITPSGKWINYKWNNGYKSCYIKKLVYKEHVYYVSAGFFPQTKENAAMVLVEAAKLYLEQVPSDIAYTRISNPRGAFVIGDVTTFVSDLEGNILADGADQANIGQNLYSYKDLLGNYKIQDAIKLAQQATGSGWIESQGIKGLQKNYISYALDKRSGKKIIIGASFYINFDESHARKLIDEAIEHINTVGKEVAFTHFSNPVGKFARGSLTISVYDLEGNNLADGEYPTLVGQNLIARKDAEGNFIVQEMIDIAKKNQSGSILSLDKHANKEIIFKPMQTKEGTLIICCSIYKTSKSFTTLRTVNLGNDYLKKHSLAQAMNEFSNTKSDFFFGDVSLFAYSSNGVILVDGENKSMIGKNYKMLKNLHEKKNIEAIIQAAQKGPGWLTLDSRNTQCRIFVLSTKSSNGEIDVILGSKYYL